MVLRCGYGILGGTFDPVHVGHLMVAEEARIRLKLDRVIFMPAGRPWLREGEELSPAHHRMAMVKRAVASNPHFGAGPNEIDRARPTYTVDTLEELLGDLGRSVKLYFILGVDALEQFHQWKEPERVLALCHLVAVGRPGFAHFDQDRFLDRYPQAAGRLELLDTPLVDISGTDLRHRAAAGESLRYQVPEAVADYIQENGLYQRDASSALVSSVEVEQAEAGGNSSDDPVSRLLRLAVERGALKYGEFALASGRKSKFYFDGRLLSLDPEGAHLIAQALLPLLRQAGAEAVGGPTLGADPMVTAVALTSRQQGGPIPAFIVRKESRAHGTQQNIEGPLVSGSRVAIIDDTCTTGGSLLHAISAAEDAGCTVVKVMTILDREEGGSEELRRRGYDFSALLTATEEGNVVPALGTSGGREPS